VEHYIVKKSPPLTCRFHRLGDEKLAAVKKEFLQMETGEGWNHSPFQRPFHREEDLGLYLWRTESANCCSRKYMQYYMSRREALPDFLKPVVH
jgi:hypothetical protein